MQMTQPICGTKPVLAARQAPARLIDDRWAVLIDLVKCRKTFGLNDRDLAVLRGLISCLPKAASDKNFVFASNITLSNRTDGMHERTLRRHLAKLVATGLIIRHSSPNGKRFVRRNHLGQAAHAFGFDLGPLFDRQADIAATAAAAMTQADMTATLREKLSLMRNDIIKIDPIFAETIRKSLRRNLTHDSMHAIIDAAKARILAADVAISPQGMSGNDSHFVRHKQKSIKDLEETELCHEQDKKVKKQSAAGETHKCQPLPVLASILQACPDSCEYAAEPVRTWPELIRFADIMAPMLQIDRDIMVTARRSMGIAAAAVAVMCILEMGDRVRSAGAYLRGLSNRAAAGTFSLQAMIQTLLSRRSMTVARE